MHPFPSFSRLKALHLQFCFYPFCDHVRRHGSCAFRGNSASGQSPARRSHRSCNTGGTCTIRRALAWRHTCCVHKLTDTGRFGLCWAFSFCISLIFFVSMCVTVFSLQSFGSPTSKTTLNRFESQMLRGLCHWPVCWRSCSCWFGRHRGHPPQPSQQPRSRTAFCCRPVAQRTILVTRMPPRFFRTS